MLIALVAIPFLVVTKVNATQTQFSITICHHTPGNDVTHTFNNLQSYLGHLGTPHSGSTYDTGGVCNAGTPPPSPSESPSPSPSESPTPSPSVNPCNVIDLDEVAKDQLVLDVPCPTESPREVGVGTTDQYHPNNDPAPVVCTEIKERPTIWEVTRNNPTSIHAKWSPIDPFVTHYKIEYGLASGIPLWNTIVEGTDTNLNFLPFNHILWLRVAGTENGCVGDYSEWIDP